MSLAGSLTTFCGRVSDLTRAAALRWGRFRRAERASREDLLAIQRRRLADLLEYAAGLSPFYRRRWGARVPRPEEFRELEPVSKTELLDLHFDEALTDRSLNRDVLRRDLGGSERAPWVVLATSGTTGEPVIVPYSRREWVEGLACALRGYSRYSPGLLHVLRTGLRTAVVATRNPIHASTRLGSSVDLLPRARLSLPAEMPLEEKIERLERYRPAVLFGYPTAVDLLARAQLEKKLSILPGFVLTGGETHPAGLRERVRAAWGAPLYDCYGLTETLVCAWECHQHCGMHIDEDEVLLEVVDDEDRLVPPGEMGASVLVTNLYNRTLPVIRYRVGDLMAVSDEPCRCGVPFARITDIRGRRDEILSLRARSGGTVEIHPAAIETVLEEIAEVRRFQIRAGGGTVRVVVVPREGSAPLEKIERGLEKALASFPIERGSVRVEMASSLEEERGATGKLRRVVGEDSGSRRTESRGIDS